MLSKPVFSKDKVLASVVLVLVVGSLVLAIIDPQTRPAFADLTKVAVGAYIGLLMPKGGVRSASK